MSTLVLGVPIVVGTVVVSVAALTLARRLPRERLALSQDAVAVMFSAVGVLYTVLLAFLVVLVWEQFNEAQERTDEWSTKISLAARAVLGLDGVPRPWARGREGAALSARSDPSLVAIRRGLAHHLASVSGRIRVATLGCVSTGWPTVAGQEAAQPEGDVDERDEHGHLDQRADDAGERLPRGGAEDADGDGDRELEVVGGDREMRAPSSGGRGSPSRAQPRNRRPT